MTITPSEELAWAAGFVDGEGSTSLQSSTRLVATVSRSDIVPLERFAAAVGRGKIYGPYSNKRAFDGKDAYQFRVHGLSAIQDVLGRIWPWLSETKREQSRTAVLNWAAAGNGQRLRSTHA